MMRRHNISRAIAGYRASGSVYFDGAGDYLTANSASFAVGTSDFTFECWVRLQNYSNDWGVMQIGPSAFGTNTPGYINSIGILVTVSGKWSFIKNGYQAGTINATLNTWTHLAVCRSGTTHKLFVNGVEASSATDSYNYTGEYLAIGCAYGTNYSLPGYVSNVRLVKGTALYTANFTPPMEPLKAITNTSFLIAGSRPWSGNPTITYNGNAANNLLNPFFK